MDDYAGRVLADRYRLPLPPSDEYELVETRAFDTYSGQEVLVRQVPLPEVVDAEVLDGEGAVPAARRVSGRAARRPTDPAVRRAIEAAQAAAQVPDHPRLDQVFDVFAEAGSLWIVSELFRARPLAALLAERPLDPFRAAEIGSDVLTALRVVHAHGWTHRNITVRTVLVCDDGRVVLTGLAAGAAEEALCGYVPTPQPEDDEDGYGAAPAYGTGPADPYEPPAPPLPPVPSAAPAEVPAARGPAAIGTGRAADDARDEDDPYTDDPYTDGLFTDAPDTEAPDTDDPRPGGVPGELEAVRRPVNPALPPSAPVTDAQARAERAGALAAYREGARAAARVGEDRRRARAGDADAMENSGTLPAQRPAQPPAEAPSEPDRDHAQPPALPPRTADHPYRAAPSEPDRDHAQPPALPPRTADHPYRAAPYAMDPYEDDGYDDGYDDDSYDAGYGDDGPSVTRRLHLTGIWSDGPGAGRPVPAGGSGEDALRADAGRHDTSPALPAHRSEPEPRPGRWDEVVASGRSGAAYRGPATTLAAERARQTRIAVVGAVTERWAPEQAGPVHENWQLAPPIGPATDLWALGALLYRAVQGHAPYPEENAAELVQMVCGEPPAFAEECGPLRPVVESLLRQDPTERPDFEEVRGWLRSLIRSAPEPGAGLDVVPLPSVDSTRLPVVRRRGELVRRRRGRQGASHGRHRHTGGKAGRHDGPREERAPRAPREPKGPKALRTPPPRHEQGGRAPRRLGRLLLLLILLALAAAVAYAVMFMPQSDSESGTRSPGTSSPTGSPDPTAGTSGGPSPSQSPGAQQPQTSRSAVALAPGYTLRKDPEGFEVGVLKGWQRSPANADRQIRYGSDGFSLLIVPGRDTVKAAGGDPLAYQADKELELQPFRDSSWSGSSGLRRIDVGRQAMAEGQFTWQDANGREVYARNLVMIVDGRYHVLQVIGPEDQRDTVGEIYEQAIASYRVTS